MTKNKPLEPTSKLSQTPTTKVTQLFGHVFLIILRILKAHAFFSIGCKQNPPRNSTAKPFLLWFPNLKAMSQESSNDKKPTIPTYMKAISGSLGGAVEASCLQPIDVIKTRLQLDRSGNYKGIIHCGSTIVRTEGVRALWKGLTPFATHLTLKYTLRMGSNAVFQSAFKDSETGELSNQGRLMSGFGAGVLEALAIVTPFEVSECLFADFF